MSSSLCQVLCASSSSQCVCLPLQHLAAMVEGQKDSHGLVAAQGGWQAPLMDMLIATAAAPPPETVSTPESAVAVAAGWEWKGAEAVCLRRLMRALHSQSVQLVAGGWRALERSAFHLRRCSVMDPFQR